MMKNLHPPIFLMFLFSVVFTNAQTFVHPGILHGKEDLKRMKEAVAEKREPVFSGYKVFAENIASSYEYKMQGPLEMVGRNPTVGQTAFDNDANAAHQNAIMWAITGDKRYADKAIEIVNAWSSTLKSITGKDAVLMAGLGPFKMINAAEILRYTSTGWKVSDIKRAEKLFKEVIYPVLKDFAPFANGNWDAAAIKTMLAIAVFCNDRCIFENAVRYYTSGWGNGSLKNYIVNENGQIQESGRDQPHSQLGIGMLAECCAIAWNQGIDLYGYSDNLLLKGFEYTARYNLGHDDMPFNEWLDRTGKYHHYKISDKGRGQLRAVFEQVYNHYVDIKGLKAPFVQQAVEKIRPEGPGNPGADHPGYGTLYFAAKKGVTVNTPAAPAGLLAEGTADAVSLSWVASVNAVTYNIKRAAKMDDTFTTIATTQYTNFIDQHVSKHRTYYYTIEAVNALGKSETAFVQTAQAGLPAGWKQANVGKSKQGAAFFNGKQISIEAGGQGVQNQEGDFYYVYTPLKKDAELKLRILPQPSSQFSIMGLMIRKDISADAPFASILLYPGKTNEIEKPDWHTRLNVRNQKAAVPEMKHTGEILQSPAVTYGRITGNYWLKLQRRGDSCKAFASYDGIHWMEAGNIKVKFGNTCLIGIAGASGMANTTNVRFDNIMLNGKLL
jgi:hypothetical protein